MAGTINTTNYNFKKYAPDDTVSMLQTFNGNMDAIDKAIKDRADVETEQGASITKLENGLSSTNNGLNSANQTISALQVQVTTNTRNIQTADTEIDALDARVQALEDGGSAIEIVNLLTAKQSTSSYAKLYKQGNHYFGTIHATYGQFTSNDIITINSADNYPLPEADRNAKLFTLQGNPFGLNPNIGHVIGVTTFTYSQSDKTDFPANYVCFAIYDGSVTYITAAANIDVSKLNITIIIDTVV